MSDNINPYTGNEPVNPYEQQPSYAQDFPESDPYTKDAYNDVFDDAEPAMQKTVAPPPVPGQGYNQNQFNGTGGPIPTQAPQNPYTGGANPTPVSAQPNPYTGGVNPTPVQTPQNPYTSAPAPTPSANTYGQNAYTSPSSTPSGSYASDGESGMGGLVCSLVSILCCGIILAPIGIILSVLALRDDRQSVKAKTGLIVGIVSLILNIVILVLSCITWFKLVEAAM